MVIKQLKNFRDDTIKLLLETILSDKISESSIVGGIKVILTLLGKKENKEMDGNETYGANLTNTVEDDLRNKIALITVPYLEKFVHLLLEPPKVS